MFDLEVAIRVCRKASVDHALALAKRNLKYDACISILTEDKKAYDAALDYIDELPFESAQKNLKKIGNILMKKCPQRTTELLKKLCTDYYQSHNNEKSDVLIHDQLDKNVMLTNQTYFFDSSPHIDRASPEDFIHFFTEAPPEYLSDFLEHLLKNMNDCAQLVYSTLIEHYLRCWKTDSKAEKRLLEILRNSSNDESNLHYDRNHVLILCSTYQFWPGIMHIYEEQKLYVELVVFTVTKQNIFIKSLFRHIDDLSFSVKRQVEIYRKREIFFISFICRPLISRAV